MILHSSQVKSCVTDKHNTKYNTLISEQSYVHARWSICTFPGQNEPRPGHGTPWVNSGTIPAIPGRLASLHFVDLRNRLIAQIFTCAFLRSTGCATQSADNSTIYGTIDRSRKVSCAVDGLVFDRRIASAWIHCAGSVTYQVTDPEP